MTSEHSRLETSKKDKLRSTRDIIIIMTCFVVLACVIFYVSKDLGRKADTANQLGKAPANSAQAVEPMSTATQEAEQVNATAEPSPQEPLALYDDNMTVPEDHYRYVQFELPVDMDLRYEYQIDSGPSLDCYIVNQDDFFKWLRMFYNDLAEAVNGETRPCLPTIFDAIRVQAVMDEIRL